MKLAQQRLEIGAVRVAHDDCGIARDTLGAVGGANIELFARADREIAARRGLRASTRREQQNQARSDRPARVPSHGAIVPQTASTHMCYAQDVNWPTRMQDGLALAAAAHDDRGAARAAPGLVASVADHAMHVARALAGRPRDARRQWIRTVLERRTSPTDVAPALRGGALLDDVAPALRGGATLRADLSAAPARARALLAASVPLALGRSWLAAAPLPRPGYVPDRGLLVVLHALAARKPG
jgi:hypothetical protein